MLTVYNNRGVRSKPAADPARLLDGTLGLINVDQNNIIKVLTIVSVVGVPPTLVASMYGMNFKHMPELDWA
jgi:magnesium transporter